MEIIFLGHASFVVEDKSIIAIDPYDISYDSKVDFIFVTHPHYDHCSYDDITKILKKGVTTIIAPEDCKDKLSTLGSRIITVEPNREYTVKDLHFKTLPAYNISKPFHPKQNRWVGYLIYLSESIYHPGDTDFIPEMKDLKPDIFLVPIGGTYTMDAEEGVKAVDAVSPQRYSIPMHYGKIVGSKNDAERFKELCSREVRILSF